MMIRFLIIYWSSADSDKIRRVTETGVRCRSSNCWTCGPSRAQKLTDFQVWVTWSPLLPYTPASVLEFIYSYTEQLEKCSQRAFCVPNWIWKLSRVKLVKNYHAEKKTRLMVFASTLHIACKQSHISLVSLLQTHGQGGHGTGPHGRPWCFLIKALQTSKVERV